MAATLNGVRFHLICYFNTFSGKVNEGGSITAPFTRRTHAGVNRREGVDLENAQKYDFIKRGQKHPAVGLFRLKKKRERNKKKSDGNAQRQPLLNAVDTVLKAV